MEVMLPKILQSTRQAMWSIEQSLDSHILCHVIRLWITMWGGFLIPSTDPGMSMSSDLSVESLCHASVWTHQFVGWTYQTFSWMTRATTRVLMTTVREIIIFTISTFTVIACYRLHALRTYRQWLKCHRTQLREPPGVPAPTSNCLKTHGKGIRNTFYNAMGRMTTEMGPNLNVYGSLQVAQLSQRNRAAGWVTFGRVVVLAWVRQYSESNVVGARKLKALIFYMINLLLYEKQSLCIFEPLFGWLMGNIRCSS